jgi:hypothetical protein
LTSNIQSARFPSLQPCFAATELSLIGLATGVPVEFLSVGGPPDSTFSDLATAFLDTNTFLDGVDDPPSVVTTSYGAMENQFESSVSKSVFHGPRSFPSTEYFAGRFVIVTWP